MYILLFCIIFHWPINDQSSISTNLQNLLLLSALYVSSELNLASIIASHQIQQIIEYILYYNTKTKTFVLNHGFQSMNFVFIK